MESGRQGKTTRVDGHPSRSLELDLPAVLQSAPHARRELTALLRGLGFGSGEGVEAARLVVTEAISNAARHAYGGERGRVRFVATVVDQLLTVSITDDGAGIPRGPGSAGPGLGLTLIAQLSERLEIEDDAGTRLVARVRLGEPGGAS